MKVACIGNMNNNFFSLTRHLRDRGIEAHLLLLDNEMPHFHPSMDAYDLEYQKFTTTLSWGKQFGFLKKTKKEISQVLNKYDFLIGCDTVPAFLHKTGRRLDVFTPYGADIVYFPFFKFVNPKYQLAYYLFSKYQKSGIQNARFVNFDYNNKDYEKLFLNLKCKGRRLKFAVPMVYTPVHNPDSIEDYYAQSHWYGEFLKIRKRYDIIVFHHARHVWKDRIKCFDWKANDKLFRGFAEFVKLKKANPCLILFEYGPDVNETRKLIKELGIEKNVRWFPQMARKDIMIGLKLADIGTGEFYWSWLLCGVVCEVLAMAKPLMHYREDHFYKELYPELYPIMNVRNSHDVSTALSDYAARPNYYRQMGEKGRQWLQRYAIDRPIDEYARIIKT